MERELEAVLGKELFELLREASEWAGWDLKEYVQWSVLRFLESDMEEIGGFGVPRAKEFGERIEKIKRSL